ncbi:MAG TPA: adenylate/guanylate cyclase domain-containing protein [Pyrinomonadaceae bacterium]|jgi:class 3 adenylate cyclase|nr:adenylate/guanylate cyclase domain-containing protein [Pyrinomonadaceae bacterium]
MGTKTRKELSRFLQERNEHPERAAEIDARIHELFAETRAVMVLDMSSFSRLTIKYGIVHFLAMVHGMNAVTAPVVEAYEGEVIKLEADNVFAVFPDVGPAIEASVDILKRLSGANTMLPDESDLYACFGIGYGEVLIIGDRDMIVEGKDVYGAEANLAFKLGEDLAQCGEILLTEAAFERVKDGPRELERVEMSISGLQLVVHKLKLKESLC